MSCSLQASYAVKLRSSSLGSNRTTRIGRLAVIALRPPRSVGHARRRERPSQTLHLRELEAVVAAGCAVCLQQAEAGPVADGPGLDAQQPRRLAGAEERIVRIPQDVHFDLSTHVQHLTFTTPALTGAHTGNGCRVVTETCAMGLRFTWACEPDGGGGGGGGGLGGNGVGGVVVGLGGGGGGNPGGVGTNVVGPASGRGGATWIRTAATDGFGAGDDADAGAATGAGGGVGVTDPAGRIWISGSGAGAAFALAAGRRGAAIAAGPAAGARMPRIAAAATAPPPPATVAAVRPRRMVASAALATPVPASGIIVSHESGPSTAPTRPREQRRKERTTSGSKSIPALRVSSARAASGDIAFWYDRSDVMAS